jgi:hypothetical protein
MMMFFFETDILKVEKSSNIYIENRKVEGGFTGKFFESPINRVFVEVKISNGGDSFPRGRDGRKFFEVEMLGYNVNCTGVHGDCNDCRGLMGFSRLTGEFCAGNLTGCAYERTASAYKLTGCAYERMASAYKLTGCAYERTASAYKLTGCAYERMASAYKRTGCAYERMASAYKRTRCAYERKSHKRILAMSAKTSGFYGHEFVTAGFCRTRHSLEHNFNNLNASIMMNKFIPEAQEAFHDWSDNFIARLSEIGAETLMPPNEYHELMRLWDDYNKKYDLADNPETKTAIAIHDRNRAREVYETDLRRLIKACIIENLAVTDAQRELMGLPIHKTTRTPAPVEKNPPYIEIVTDTLRELILKYGTSKHSKAKPEGQHGVETVWVISQEKPSGIEKLIHSVFDTRTPLVLKFTEEERGKTVWFAMRWENTRGEKGPFSPIYYAIIP